jgi:hypothetical protein
MRAGLHETDAQPFFCNEPGDNGPMPCCGPGAPGSLTRTVSAMKIAILQNPAFRFFLFASVVAIIGLLGFSISSYDKGGDFPVLLLLSEIIIAIGAIAALLSLVICLAMQIFQRPVSPEKHPTP